MFNNRVLQCVLQVNLMQYMKLSTSRDFRINTATLEAALQEQQHESQQVCLLMLSYISKSLGLLFSRYMESNVR